MRNAILLVMVLVVVVVVGCGKPVQEMDSRVQASLYILVADAPDADGNWTVLATVGPHRWKVTGKDFQKLADGIASHAGYIKKECTVVTVRMDLPIEGCPPELSLALANAANVFQW